MGNVNKEPEPDLLSAMAIGLFWGIIIGIAIGALIWAK